MLSTFIAAAAVMNLPTVARFIAVAPPIVFQPNVVTSCELSPVDPQFAWNEAIVSWNVSQASGANLLVEARAVYPDKVTKWYTMAKWSLDGSRQSVDGQKDDDGTVNTDTLSLKRPGGQLQLRLTGTASDPNSKLTFVGVSFSDTTAQYPADEPDKFAWGKRVDTVTPRHQMDYPGGGGLCSPTSVSMVLSHWSQVLSRPELNLDVPEVEAGVWDPVYNGAGNWPFNTAFAGSFPGLRGYVSRFSSISELETWTAAGYPVICSVSYQLIRGLPLDRATEQGHLELLIGFTAEGDPVFNDPASNETFKVYGRQDFERAWDYSRRTVYLVYPATADVPVSEYGHWVGKS